MIARTAYTQLGYSLFVLLITTLLMLLVFWVPIYGLFVYSVPMRFVALVALVLMGIGYLPTLRYYRRSVLWMVGLPLVGLLYLLMTWSSAIRFWQGKRSQWKGRIYGR